MKVELYSRNSEPPPRGRKVDAESVGAIVLTYVACSSMDDYRDGWDIDIQDSNFSQMMSLVDKVGGRPCMYSCLDVGCGSGNFGMVWRGNGGGEYTGIDLLPIEQNPDIGTFVMGEFSRCNLEQHDLVFASGSLSVGKPRDRMKFFDAYVSRMAHLARYGFYLNFWSDELDHSKTDMQNIIRYDCYETKQHVNKLANKMGFPNMVTNHEVFTFEDGNTDFQEHIWVYR